MTIHWYLKFLVKVNFKFVIFIVCDKRSLWQVVDYARKLGEFELVQKPLHPTKDGRNFATCDPT